MNYISSRLSRNLACSCERLVCNSYRSVLLLWYIVNDIVYCFDIKQFTFVSDIRCVPMSVGFDNRTTTWHFTRVICLLIFFLQSGDLVEEVSTIIHPPYADGVDISEVQVRLTWRTCISSQICYLIWILFKIYYCAGCIFIRHNERIGDISSRTGD